MNVKGHNQVVRMADIVMDDDVSDVSSQHTDSQQISAEIVMKAAL